MPRIDASQKVVTLKLVYYGPALGGKTTNLRALHQIADPQGRIELRSLDTEGDRTLFFDLLPIDLGNACGLDLRVRLFTVPGQVHYNGTRRLVLQGADAVVFVADSGPDRIGASQESLRNLRANFLANGIAPGLVPIIVQANKRDLPGAVPVDQMERALGPEHLEAHASTMLPGMLLARAAQGMGVIETFEAALRAALTQAFRHHGLAKLGVPRERLAMRLDETLAPIRARAARMQGAPLPQLQSPPAHQAEAALAIDDQLAESVRQSLDLAEALGDQSAQRQQLARRVNELETINELSRVLVQALEVRHVATALAQAARAAFPDGAASVLLPKDDGTLVEAALVKLPVDPLLSAGRPPLAWRVARQSRAIAWSDLETELAGGDADLASRLAPFCTAAAAPLRMPSGRTGLVVAYGHDPDARAGAETTRFLAAIAAQGSLALQNADRHAQLQQHGARLEHEVAARTAELRLAHQELVAGSRMKDRILSCVNHELRTPVTKLLAASQVLERMKPGSTPPPAMLQGITVQAKHLKALLDQVLAANVLLAPAGDTAGDVSADLARTLEAASFACAERAAARQVTLKVDGLESAPRVVADAGPLSLVLTQLVDNAVKFTRQGTCVRAVIEPAQAGFVRVLVSDEGPGVRVEDAGRIFAEFDQGSGDHLTAKPTGLGLGLAIARRLARKFGGDVEVTNPGVAGAAFAMRLRVAAEPSPVASDAVAAVAGSR